MSCLHDWVLAQGEVPWDTECVLCGLRRTIPSPAEWLAKQQDPSPEPPETEAPTTVAQPAHLQVVVAREEAEKPPEAMQSP